MSSSQRNELYCVAPPSDRIACRVQRSDAKYRWNAPFNVSPLVEEPMTRTFAALSTLLLAVASVAWAYPSGISGQTTAGCTCHSTSPSSATSLSLSGPTTVNQVRRARSPSRCRIARDHQRALTWQSSIQMDRTLAHSAPSADN